MDDHDLWVERGFCPEIYGGRWCRLRVDHEDQHVAPWQYEFPKQETMVRWNGTGEDASDVEWLYWVPRDIASRSEP